MKILLIQSLPHTKREKKRKMRFLLAYPSEHYSTGDANLEGGMQLPNGKTTLKKKKRAANV